MGDVAEAMPMGEVVPLDPIDPRLRRELLNALRRGTVPASRLDMLAVGMGRFEPTLVDELDQVAEGRGILKAVRGDYGGGKTFTVRWFQDLARQRGFATAEVQISEVDTPLHKLETIYRRLIEALSTEDVQGGALKSVIDCWFYALEEEAIANADSNEEPDEATLLARTNELMEARLEEVTRRAPAFAACLRGYRQALADGDRAQAEGLISWLSGEPNVAASVKRAIGLKGEIDHTTALGFLKGLLRVLRDSDHAGLVLVLDEVETVQRVPTNMRDKGYNALRQWMDEVDRGVFPGLYLMITGNPAFFEGQNGIKRLEPLEQRLHVDFKTEARFDNPRAVQIRLEGFNIERLVEVAVRVRNVFASGAKDPVRINRVADDAYLRTLANAVAGKLGNKIGIAPRLFLKKLVGDVLDRIDQFEDFDPRVHYQLTIDRHELTEVERNAAAGRVSGVDDITIELDDD